MALLRRWGYPHVLEHFRFHMTLTGRLEAAELEIALACARAHFSPFLAAPVRLDTVAMFVQEEPDDPFRIHTAVTIGGH